jgi:signal transduction histidine kinase
MAEFAAGAAHEIKNPLAVISGQAQYLLQHEDAAERREPLQKIVAQTQRIHNILTDVLQFARPPAPHKQPVDVGTLIRETAAALRPLADERGVRLLCQEPDPPITLDADATQLGKALRALLQNAVEAAGAEGWASVRAERPHADLLYLIVEDSGRGPDVADPSALFDPFYSGREAGRGRGMGLPIAWQIARQHGGDVAFDLTSPPTRVVLSLPVAPLPEQVYLQNGTPELRVSDCPQITTVQMLQN